MIRRGKLFDYKEVDGLIGFARAYPDYTIGVARDVWGQIEPLFMDELTYTPDLPEYPLEWQSDRQRKAFFATDGFGKGIPYPRSGRLQESWYTRLDVQRSGLSLTLANSVPYGPFVVGDLIPGRRQNPQQKMHINTGWQPVAETVSYWQGVIGETYISEWNTQLDQLPIFR